MADFLWICIRDGFNLGLAIRVHNEKKGRLFASARLAPTLRSALDGAPVQRKDEGLETYGSYHRSRSERCTRP
jgi:hypothetical protein